MPLCVMGLFIAFTCGCNTEDPADYATTPHVDSHAVEEITDTTAITGGKVNLDGGATVTQRGVCYGTSPDPTIADAVTDNGSGLGMFISNLTGLTAGTTYYVRAYATNIAGTYYGYEVVFTTTGSGGGGGGGGTGIETAPGQGVTFSGHAYSSIVLGNGQEWMAENLRTAVYANGDPIPNLQHGTEWINSENGAWVHYNNDAQFENPYGKLYNWHAVNDPRNVCPAGWHVPSEDDWNEFTLYLDPTVATNFFNNVGGKMKSTGTQYWQSPNQGATNESGFSGLPGGGRVPGGFFGINGMGSWWSSTYNSNGYANTRNVRSDEGRIFMYGGSVQDGLSIRCIKD